MSQISLCGLDHATTAFKVSKSNHNYFLAFLQIFILTLGSMCVQYSLERAEKDVFIKNKSIHEEIHF